MGGHATTGRGDSGQGTLLDLPTGQPSPAEFYIERDFWVGGVGLGYLVQGVLGRWKE